MKLCDSVQFVRGSSERCFPMRRPQQTHALMCTNQTVWDFACQLGEVMLNKNLLSISPRNAEILLLKTSASFNIGTWNISNRDKYLLFSSKVAPMFSKYEIAIHYYSIQREILIESF